jgi:hypothetical protein
VPLLLGGRYVGNTMATFVMQALGCEVAAANTVNFSEFYFFSFSSIAIVACDGEAGGMFGSSRIWKSSIEGCVPCQDGRRCFADATPSTFTHYSPCPTMANMPPPRGPKATTQATANSKGAAPPPPRSKASTTACANRT